MTSQRTHEYTAAWVAENEEEAARTLEYLSARLAAADQVRAKASARAMMVLIVVGSMALGATITVIGGVLFFRPLDQVAANLNEISLSLRAHGVVKDVAEMIQTRKEQ